jgi:hypothetical protein
MVQIPCQKFPPRFVSTPFTKILQQNYQKLRPDLNRYVLKTNSFSMTYHF